MAAALYDTSILEVSIDYANQRRTATLKETDDILPNTVMIPIGRKSKESYGLLRVYCAEPVDYLHIHDSTPFKASGASNSQPRPMMQLTETVEVHIRLHTQQPLNELRECTGRACMGQKRLHDDDEGHPIDGLSNLWYLFGSAREIIAMSPVDSSGQQQAKWMCLEIPVKICHQISSGYFEVSIGQRSGCSNVFTSFDPSSVSQVSLQPITRQGRALTRSEALEHQWADAVARAIGVAHITAPKRNNFPLQPNCLEGALSRLKDLQDVAHLPENTPAVILHELQHRLDWLQEQIYQLPKESRLLCKFNVYPEVLDVLDDYQVVNLNCHNQTTDHCLGIHDPVAVLARWCFTTRMPYDRVVGSVLTPYWQARRSLPSIKTYKDKRIWLILAVMNVDYFCFFTLFGNVDDPSITDLHNRLLQDELRLPGIPTITSYPVSRVSSVGPTSSSVAAERGSRTPTSTAISPFSQPLQPDIEDWSLEEGIIIE